TKRMLDLYNQPFDMITSPFAFPRLPPRVNPSLGISNVSKIKDVIVRDKDAMMGRLDGHHAMFQHYASGLFNLSPSQFMPGHPMHSKIQSVDALREENERLQQENSVLKANKNKEKKN
ncbi:MAG: hypothetical protein KGH83_06690, partial [Thaumarchaeota archaeon]|nr:hypothetical protein [Nitrososphaerota archaeon]